MDVSNSWSLRIGNLLSSPTVIIDTVTSMLCPVPWDAFSRVMDHQMLKTSPRVTGVAKRRKYLVGHRLPSLTGYNRWFEYVEAYWSYIDTDLELQWLTVYSRWIDDSHTLVASTLEDEIPHLPERVSRKVGPPGQSKRQPQPQLAEAPLHLYALDVDDLLDFTEADIFAAWDLRVQTCGSREAAAELYALYRVLEGIDEFYAGSTAYLEHPDVVAIFVAAETGAGTDVQIDGSAKCVPGDSEVLTETQSADGLTLWDIRKLSLAELKLAWANRPDSFASLEAAAETLAALRAVNSQEFGTPNYRQLMGHALIQELEYSLPLEGARVPIPSPAVELELLNTDRRAVRIQASVVRQGQGNFRAAMLERYGAQCVITGCRIDTLLEAAHIIPYRGDQSHDELNGLLLRVDIHRLFDAHLISINPKTLTVELACALSDETYQDLQGKRLFVFSPKPRVLYLEVHHRQFMAVSRYSILDRSRESPSIS